MANATVGFSCLWLLPVPPYPGQRLIWALWLQSKCVGTEGWLSVHKNRWTCLKKCTPRRLIQGNTVTYNKLSVVFWIICEESLAESVLSEDQASRFPAALVDFASYSSRHLPLFTEMLLSTEPPPSAFVAIR